MAWGEFSQAGVPLGAPSGGAAPLPHPRLVCPRLQGRSRQGQAWTQGGGHGASTPSHTARHQTGGRGCLKNTAPRSSAPPPSGRAKSSCASRRPAEKAAPPAGPRGAWGRGRHQRWRDPGASELPRRGEERVRHAGLWTAGGERAWPGGDLGGPCGRSKDSPPSCPPPPVGFLSKPIAKVSSKYRERRAGGGDEGARPRSRAFPRLGRARAKVTGAREARSRRIALRSVCSEQRGERTAAPGHLLGREPAQCSLTGRRQRPPAPQQPPPP